MQYSLAHILDCHVQYRVCREFWDKEEQITVFMGKMNSISSLSHSLILK